jgi:2-polyprenyl-6-hydroxyphenyl methylase/3-demethylubiquinone-9 3-methyltransferase
MRCVQRGVNGRMSLQHAEEIRSGQRFAFGKNWARFLNDLNDTRIRQAEQSLRGMLGESDLQNKRFLDAGSGSGLFSLAARRLGATVVSFDYDPESVACTNELKRRYYPDDSHWSVGQGSVLDEHYVASLGAFDVVYSWGVLHHTGHMYRAIVNITGCVAANGRLFIAIYNDQGWISRYWSAVKRLYNKSAVTRMLVVLVHAPYLLGLRWVVRAASRRPLERGMALRYDMLDWLGGYPFEVAKPESILAAVRDGGFSLDALKTCGGRMGCNEYLFRRRNGDDKQVR